MSYKSKPFGEVFIGDIFQFNSVLYDKIDSDLAADLCGRELEIDDDCVVLDLSSPIEEALKIEALDAGKHEWSGDRLIIAFSEARVNEEFSSLGVSYLKKSNERLENGSNSIRLDGSTVYIAEDRKVEVYR